MIAQEREGQATLTLSVPLRRASRASNVFTERDYAGNVVLKGRSSPQTLVRDVMSAQVVCVELDDTVEDCMALMTRKRVRHLPVIEDEAVVGTISIGDLVKSTIDNQRFTIDQLETYIRGELYVH